MALSSPLKTVVSIERGATLPPPGLSPACSPHSPRPGATARPPAHKMPLLEEYANAAALLEQSMPKMPLPTNLEQAGEHLRNEYAALAEQLRETGQHALLDALPPESHLFRAAGDDSEDVCTIDVPMHGDCMDAHKGENEACFAVPGEPASAALLLGAELCRGSAGSARLRHVLPDAVGSPGP